MTNKEEIHSTVSQIARASVLESHGWSTEPNRSQCKFRVQEINSFVFLFLLLNFFLLVRATPFFILPDIGVNKGLAKRYVGGRIPKVWSASDHRYVLHSFKIKRTRRNAKNF